MKTLNKPGLMLFIGIWQFPRHHCSSARAQGYLPSTLVAAGRLIFAYLASCPVHRENCLERFHFFTPRQRLRIVVAGIFLGVQFFNRIKSLELTQVASSVILVTTHSLSGWLFFHPFF